MIRDEDLIYGILKWASEKQDARALIPPFGKYTEEQVHCHIGLCYERGYVEIEPLSRTHEQPYPRYFIRCLTIAGREAFRAMQ